LVRERHRSTGSRLTRHVIVNRIRNLGHRIPRGDVSVSGSTHYAPELGERAVRVAIEIRVDYKPEWATSACVSKLIGVSTNTLRL